MRLFPSFASFIPINDDFLIGGAHVILYHKKKYDICMRYKVEI